MNRQYWLTCKVSHLAKECVMLVADYMYYTENKDLSLALLPFEQRILSIEKNIEEISNAIQKEAK